MAAYIATESGSADVARKAVDRIRERCRKMAALPGTLGRSRPELGDGIRSFVSGSYVVLFRYGGGTLEIVNIVEGHRDIESSFEEPKDPE
ncbi:MAG: type II toxin-antitoxin system RelE/ParE family toxin [Mesorhizobium sp.]|nr:type II toxin-antitoxin system RelE/ParE family toxin [Mesorhizobium sp.]MCO5160356.1 type II toxin-antitoxin system RelE/ParE family toxin [Mesorhizobium sp.]